MNALIESIKKIGAGIIVIILIIMMGVTFSSQPMDEILSILAGGGKLGHFQGKEISGRVYMLAYDQCQERYRMFGTVPDYILDQCTANEIKNLYVIPGIGSHLGIRLSKAEAEKQINEAAVAAFRAQNADLAHSDDRLTLREIYNLEIQRNPLEVRMAVENTMRTYNALRTFPVPESVKNAAAAGESITFNVKAVHYTTVDLLRSMDSGVTITEEEIKKAYEEDQKAKPEAEKKPYDSEKERIRNQLQTEKKQARLNEARKTLSELKSGFTLDDVTRITGITAETLGEKNLNSLNSVALGSGSPVAMNKSGIYAAIAEARSADTYTAGPFEDGDRTYYLEISGVKTGTHAETDEGKAAETEVYYGSYMLQYLLDQEAVLGDFLFRPQTAEAAN